MFKMIKWGLIGVTGIVAVGALFFGTELFSYATTSGKMLKDSVKRSIPIPLEIERARNLLEEIIPEMHTNLRTVAMEEVEVAQLEKEVQTERESIEAQRTVVQNLREKINVIPTSSDRFTEDRQDEVVEDLSLRFERLRTAELLHTGKTKLLSNRRKSLQAAIGNLQKTRLARLELAAQIEALEGQFRLLRAQGTSSNLELNTTKLAQTQRVLKDLRKRLEVAQRIMEREACFDEPLSGSTVCAESLVEEIDRHFGKSETASSRSTY